MVRWREARKGAALLLTFLMLLVLAGLALAVGTAAHNSMVGARSQLQDKQAFYIAEAGWQRARQALAAGTWMAGNTYTESFGAGEYEVTITDNGDDTYTITSEGYTPTQAAYTARRQVQELEVDAALSNTNYSLAATASASSSNGGDTPDKANDGDTGTHWKAGTKGSGEWLAMDLGSAILLDRIIIEENSNINGVSIESSSDGSSWSTVSGLSVTESPSKTWTADFTDTTARYFRAVLTASGSGKRVSVEEFESYNTANQSVSLDTGDFVTTW